MFLQHIRYKYLKNTSFETYRKQNKTKQILTLAAPLPPGPTRWWGQVCPAHWLRIADIKEILGLLYFQVTELSLKTSLANGDAALKTPPTQEVPELQTKKKKVKKCKRKSWKEHNYTNNLFLQVVNLTFQITFCCFGDFHSRSIFYFCLIFNTFCLIWLAQIWFHIDQSWSGTTYTVETL